MSQKNQDEERNIQHKKYMQKNQKKIIRTNEKIRPHQLCKVTLNKNGTAKITATNHRNTMPTYKPLPNGKGFDQVNKKFVTQKNVKSKDVKRSYTTFLKSANKTGEIFESSVARNDKLILFTLTYNHNISYTQVYNDSLNFIRKILKHITTKETVLEIEKLDTDIQSKLKGKNKTRKLTKSETTKILNVLLETLKIKYLIRLEFTQNYIWHSHILLSIDVNVLKKFFSYKDIRKEFENMVIRRKIPKSNENTRNCFVYISKLKDNIHSLSRTISYLKKNNVDFTRYPNHKPLMFTNMSKSDMIQFTTTFEEAQCLTGTTKDDCINSYSTEVTISDEKTLKIQKEQYLYQDENLDEDKIFAMLKLIKEIAKEKSDDAIKEMAQKIKRYIDNVHSTDTISDFSYEIFAKLFTNDCIIVTNTFVNRKQKKGKFRTTIYFKKKKYNKNRNVPKRTKSLIETYWLGISISLEHLRKKIGTLQNTNIWLISYSKSGIKTAIKESNKPSEIQKGKYTSTILSLIKEEENFNNKIFSLNLHS